jgi:hypothetical protein
MPSLPKRPLNWTRFCRTPGAGGSLGDLMRYYEQRDATLFSLKRTSPDALAVEDDLHHQGIIDVAEQLGCGGPGEFNLTIARGLKARLTWQGRLGKGVADAMPLDEIARIMEGWLAEKAMQVNADGPALSAKQYRFLQALAVLKAFAPESRCTTEDAVARAEGTGADSASFKAAVAQLAELKLIETKTGRGGGCWLTGEGRALLEKIKKR